MDELEKQIVRKNIPFLVRECKANELLDHLISKEAIEDDDYQRVFKGQVTDSDKMRELLVILLRKTRIKNGDVFQALLDALKETKREDVAERLIKGKSTKSPLSNRHEAVNSQTIPSRNNSGFCFTPAPHTVSSVFSPDHRGRNIEGMDVADCISNTTTTDQCLLASNDLCGLTEKDKDIWRKVQGQRSQLIELLIPRDILHYSLVLRQELGAKNVEAILSLSENKGITAAAETFLEYLEKSESCGIWTAFEDILRSEGYKRLLNLLDGKMNKDDDDHMDYIKISQSFVKFDPIGLLDRLISKNVLDQRHSEKIKAKDNNNGKTEATALFFDYLQRSKSSDWYRQFMFALKEVGLNTVIEDIDLYFWKREKLWEDEDGALFDRCLETDVETDETEVKTLDSLEDMGKLNNLDDGDNSLKPSTSKSFDDKELGEFNVKFSEMAMKDDQTAITDESTDPKLALQAEGTDISNMTELSSDSEDKIETEDLELRDYQNELAEASLKGNNCIIVAPTGSGKTHVALKIMQNHFLKKESVKKVVFLVNNVALATQQFKACKRYLSNQRVRLLSGGSTEQLELGLLMPSYDIFVMTAQILVDAIREERDVNFMVAFTLMIFDECHHTDKNHSYNKIMFTYMEKKLTEENRLVLPQVVGLTASVGVGKAKGVSQATEHIKKLCANLDAEQICTVQKCVGQLRHFVSVPAEETTEVEGRRSDPFRDMLQEQMTLIEKMIKEKHAAAMREGLELRALVEAPPIKGAQEYSQWISKTRKTVAILDEARIRRYFNTCLVFVEKYNNALIINSDVRTRDALQYLIEEFNKRDSTRHEVDIQLKKWFTDKRQAFESICVDPNYRNPKLMELEKMILKAYKEKPDSRGIIFVKTKDLVAAICCWMKDSPSLKSLNPHKLTGQSSEESGGMTQNQQVDVLTFFKNGKHKIIIATSVAEEGLDIQKCNLVIRYDYVTNVVAMMQARGRGRAEDSEYKVLATKGKGIAEREELNMIREVMMEKAIKELQSSMESDPHTYLQTIVRLQQEAKHQRDLLASQTNHRVFQEGDFELRCFHCDKMACFTSDLRVLESNHRVAIVDDFLDQVDVLAHPRPKNYGEFNKRGKVYCKQCGYDWGVVSGYKGHVYYILKISSFVVSDFDQRRSTCKKWKDAPFEVKELAQSDYEIINVISRQLMGVLSNIGRSTE